MNFDQKTKKNLKKKIYEKFFVFFPKKITKILQKFTKNDQEIEQFPFESSPDFTLPNDFSTSSKIRSKTSQTC